MDELEAIARRLASEIEHPAGLVKEHGRKIFESVVELDSAIEVVLTAMEKDPGGMLIEENGPSPLIGLPAVVDQGIDALEEIHEAIRGLEPGMPILRTPLRNVRAGLRDVMDARPIFAEWEQRAQALVSQENG